MQLPGQQQGGGGDDLLADGVEELPLALHAAQVTAGVEVAGADETQGGHAVHRLAPGLDVEVGLLVDDVGLRADLHPPEVVDDVGEPAEADLGVPVDAQAGVLLHGVDEERGTAHVVARVDLVLAHAADGHVGVARDGHEGRGAEGGHVHEHDRVGASPLRGARAQTVALLRGEAVASVGTHQQVVAPRGVGRSALPGGHGVGAFHRAPGVEDRRAGGDEPHREQHHQAGQDLADRSPACAAPSRGGSVVDGVGVSRVAARALVVPVVARGAVVPVATRHAVVVAVVPLVAVRAVGPALVAQPPRRGAGLGGAGGHPAAPPAVTVPPGAAAGDPAVLFVTIGHEAERKPPRWEAAGRREGGAACVGGR